MLTSLEQVLSLLQQTASEVAGNKGSTVLVYPVGEVLAGDADLTTLPALELVVIDVIPFFHGS